MFKLRYRTLISILAVLLIGCSNTGVLPVNQKVESTSPIIVNTSPLPLSAEQTKEEPTPVPLPTTAPRFSAEKFNLVPYHFNYQLPPSALKQIDGPIVVSGWSHNGKKVIFGYKTADRRFDPTAKENKALTGSDGFYFNGHNWIANADGSNPQKITEWSGGGNLWSPDDSHLLYAKRTGVSKKSFWVVNLNTMTHIELATPPGEVMGKTHFYDKFLWLDNNHLFYPTYGADKSRTLWRHNIETNEFDVINVDEAIGYPWRSLYLSPDRNYVIGRTEQTTWLGQVITNGEVVRLDYVKTFFTNGTTHPFWAPDSKKIAITISGYREQFLYIVNIDTDDKVEVQFPLAIRSVIWSSDSQMLLVITKPSGTDMVTPVHVVNVDGSGQRLFWRKGYITYWKSSLDGQYLIWYQIDGPQEIFKMELK